MAVTGHGLNFKDGTDTTVTVVSNAGLDAVDITIGVATTSFTRKDTLTTKGDIYIATASATITRLGVGANGTVLKAASGQTEGAKWEAVAESEMTFTDITTNDVSTTKHGFTPKAPNDTAKFLRGDGVWASVGGGGGGSSAMATDVIWDAKGDFAVGSGADAASVLGVGANDTILVADSAQTLGVKWGTVPDAWTKVTKGSDESVNSSGTGTTLQADDALLFTAAASAVYEFEILLIYASPAGGATPDLKVALGEDATTRGQSVAYEFFTTSDTATAASGVVACNQTAIFGFGTNAADRVARIRGWYIGNGGTFNVLWAQNTSNANNTTVRAGSTLRYRVIS